MFHRKRSTLLVLKMLSVDVVASKGEVVTKNSIDILNSSSLMVRHIPTISEFYIFWKGCEVLGSRCLPWFTANEKLTFLKDIVLIYLRSTQGYEPSEELVLCQFSHVSRHKPEIPETVSSSVGHLVP